MCSESDSGVGDDRETQVTPSQEQALAQGVAALRLKAVDMALLLPTPVKQDLPGSSAEKVIDKQVLKPRGKGVLLGRRAVKSNPEAVSQGRLQLHGKQRSPSHVSLGQAREHGLLGKHGALCGGHMA